MYNPYLQKQADMLDLAASPLIPLLTGGAGGLATFLLSNDKSVANRLLKAFAAGLALGGATLGGQYLLKRYMDSQVPFDIPTDIHPLPEETAVPEEHDFPLMTALGGALGAAQGSALGRVASTTAIRELTKLKDTLRKRTLAQKKQQLEKLLKQPPPTGKKIVMPPGVEPPEVQDLRETISALEKTPARLTPGQKLAVRIGAPTASTLAGFLAGTGLGYLLD